MESLTRTAYWSRRTIKFGFIALVLFVALKFSFQTLAAYWRAKNPPSPPPPNVVFGKLPSVLTTTPNPEKPTSFQLETIDGQLPIFPAQEKVYFLTTQQSRFLAMEEVQKLSQRFGFVSQPEKIREDLFRYRNQVANTTLTINPVTLSFKIEYPYLKDQTLTTLFLPPQTKIIDLTWTTLSKVGREHPDLAREKTEIIFWKLLPTQLLPAPSLSEANLAQVNLFRQEIENKPLLPPDLKKPNIWFMISGSDTQNKKVVEFNYTYFPVDKEKFATYPLTPIAQAWEKLKKGEYHLARINSSLKKEPLVIRNVYLAYFDPVKPTNFLQPIYVFEGEAEFVAYIAALSVEWVGE